jgi:hypothetical protein
MVRRVNNAADPEFWWRRAKQARSQADRVTEPGHKRAMILIAQGYERRGAQAEEQLRQEPHPLMRRLKLN